MTENEIKHLLDQLNRLSEVDIRTVDPKALVDIQDIIIDESLPIPDRIRQYIRQIKNPYCYLSHGTVVKIRFDGSKTLEECLKDCIKMQA